MPKAEEKPKQKRREMLSLSQENEESLYIFKGEFSVL